MRRRRGARARRRMDGDLGAGASKRTFSWAVVSRRQPSTPERAQPGILIRQRSTVQSHEVRRGERGAAVGDRRRLLAVRLERLGLRPRLRVDGDRHRAPGARPRRQPHRHRRDLRPRACPRRSSAGPSRGAATRRSSRRRSGPCCPTADEDLRARPALVDAPRHRRRSTSTRCTGPTRSSRSPRRWPACGACRTTASSDHVGVSNFSAERWAQGRGGARPAGAHRTRCSSAWCKRKPERGVLPYAQAPRSHRDRVQPARPGRARRSVRRRQPAERPGPAATTRCSCPRTSSAPTPLIEALREIAAAPRRHPRAGRAGLADPQAQRRRHPGRELGRAARPQRRRRRPRPDRRRSGRAHAESDRFDPVSGAAVVPGL